MSDRSFLGLLGGRPLPDRPRDTPALATVRVLFAVIAFAGMIGLLAWLFDVLVAAEEEVIWPFDAIAAHAHGWALAAYGALGASSPTALGVVQTWPFFLLTVAYIAASTFFDPRPTFVAGVPVGAMGVQEGSRNLYLLKLVLNVFGAPGRFVGYAFVELVRSVLPEDQPTLAPAKPPAPDERRPLDREKSEAWRRRMDALSDKDKRR